MKKFWELPLWFFDILDFIKNSILIYIIISFICWNIDITTWSFIARFTFTLGIIVNIVVCFKND